MRLPGVGSMASGVVLNCSVCCARCGVVLGDALAPVWLYPEAAGAVVSVAEEGSLLRVFYGVSSVRLSRAVRSSPTREVRPL